MTGFSRAAFLAGTATVFATPARTFAQAAPASAVRVGILNSLSEAPLLLAKARNYFSDAGLDVTLVPFQNTADMVVPLASGQIDVGSGAPTLGYFNAVMRGITTKLVGDKGRLSPGHGFDALVVRKDLVTSGKVKSVRDLKGMNVATPSRWSPMEYLLDTALRQDGSARIEELKLIQLAFPDMIVALKNGAVDAALLIEPFVAETTRDGVATRILGFDTTAPNFQIASILYSDAFSKRDAVAKNWMVAYIRGIREYLRMLDRNGDRNALLDIMAQNFEVKDRSIYDGVVLPGYERDGYLNLDSLTASMGWFKSHGQLVAQPTLRQIVDYSFVDAALTTLPRFSPKQVVP
jgi:NitT/TauT family transport system substrate-binding protein